jgi:hypothetical protein
MKVEIKEAGIETITIKVSDTVQEKQHYKGNKKYSNQ